jgi:hypothetical protein
MQKLFYLLFDDANSDGSLLREAIADRVVPILRGSGAGEISSFVADDEVAAGSPLRQSDPPIRAALSFSLEKVGDLFPIEAVLDDLVARKAGYLVAESRPMPHDRKVGHRTRGMMQMSCISQRPDISHDEFLRIWHQEHAKVAIETQSTFGYVRNEILGTLTDGAPEHWSAIVEESFPIEALENAMVFFDAETETELVENRKRMLESCGRFLDLTRIEVTFMSETYFG